MGGLMPDPKTRAPTERPSRRAWALYLLLGLFAAMLLARPQAPGARIPYSEFKQRLEAGQISDVELSKDRVRATPSDEAARRRGERWIALRVDDPDLVKQLEAKHVSFTGIPDGDWLSSLFLVWLLPMLLLGGFWLLVLRRMRPGAGVMSIGRSRAKL